MPRSDVHAWFTAYDRKQRSLKEGRAGLAWLGLIGEEERKGSPASDYFERKAEFVGPGVNWDGGMSLTKPVGAATRLALLLWAGTIASLAVLFG